MHSCIVWRKLQSKGIKLSIQGTLRSHNNTFQTRLFLQFMSQFLNPITLESKRIPLHNSIIFSHMIEYSPPLWPWWCCIHIIQTTRLQTKTQKKKQKQKTSYSKTKDFNLKKNKKKTKTKNKKHLRTSNGFWCDGGCEFWLGDRAWISTISTSQRI